MDVLLTSLVGSQKLVVEILPANHVTDLKYTDDIALLGDDLHSEQYFLNRLVEASKHDICFPPLNIKCYSRTGRRLPTHIP